MMRRRRGALASILHGAVWVLRRRRQSGSWIAVVAAGGAVSRHGSLRRGAEVGRTRLLNQRIRERLEVWRAWW